ncbi:class Ib ribonucleoside-diphosphate reductase assembly flavoprotein NrdI [Polycladidibacter hongkongensis]|uniref:class Ib ribonucleoside-diphosphate reductase assembly flavoprotein NrdI n=1 Tax=Polycladidibacter hongkongensis TaxID=1647556 RepID=UPI0008375F1F|nr:class Ib ribonucleoside-diphosphate reductase assembly flavoprotein NrdI [Pseudovibrio hongkongensis]
MAELVYFSSASGNTQRFIERLGLPAQRLPLSDAEPLPIIRKPYVLISPTYADGEGRGAVHKQVIRFLNVAANRELLRGVIASGNRNFGAFFAHAGTVISAKCGCPCLYKFELAGTQSDVERVRQGLEKFWKQQH